MSPYLPFIAYVFPCSGLTPHLTSAYGQHIAINHALARWYRYRGTRTPEDFLSLSQIASQLDLGISGKLTDPSVQRNTFNLPDPITDRYGGIDWGFPSPPPSPESLTSQLRKSQANSLLAFDQIRC